MWLLTVMIPIHKNSSEVTQKHTVDEFVYPLHIKENKNGKKPLTN